MESRRTLGSSSPMNTTKYVANHAKYPQNQCEDRQNKLHNSRERRGHLEKVGKTQFRGETDHGYCGVEGAKVMEKDERERGTHREYTKRIFPQGHQL